MKGPRGVVVPVQPIAPTRLTALHLAIQSCGVVTVQGGTENILTRADKFLLWLTSEADNRPE